MLLKKIAKQLLYISRMSKLCAILQLVSVPLNPLKHMKTGMYEFSPHESNL